MSIAVDDCTGWAITGEFGQLGAAGHHLRLRPAGNRAGDRRVRASGPGTLTLSSALKFTHQPGVMVTTLPQSVIDAMILFSVAEALIRGATSTTVHQIPGGAGGDAGGKGMGPPTTSQPGERLASAVPAGPI